MGVQHSMAVIFTFLLTAMQLMEMRRLAFGYLKVMSPSVVEESSTALIQLVTYY